MPLQATSGAASYDAFGGGVPVVPNYIEDVFSTYLYTGNETARTIVNGIDVSTKGGLVWCKSRNTVSTSWHNLFDTGRGNNQALYSNSTSASTDYGSGSWSPATTGFNLGDAISAPSLPNRIGDNYVSWTFRKQPKFFDVQTYTGNGTGKTVSHSLVSTPAFVIVKRTDSTGDWYVWNVPATGTINWGKLNSTAAFAADWYNYFDGIGPTTFTPLGSGPLNTNGATYVAYFFAHNAGGFGLTGTDNVISCGSMSVTAGGDATVTLGYEPQWVLTKRIDAAGGWGMFDNMRGWASTGTALLLANSSSAESNYGATPVGNPTATGFTVQNFTSTSGSTYIYIAIRRGPMKVPTSGTSVYLPYAASKASGGVLVDTGFDVDFILDADRAGAGFNHGTATRLTGNDKYFGTSQTAAEGTYAVADFRYSRKAKTTDYFDGTSGTAIGHFFRRAPSFFDVVCYTGDGTSGRQITHNLTVAPELMIVRARNGSQGSTSFGWRVYAAPLGPTKYIALESTGAAYGPYSDWNLTTPTSTVFSVYDSNEGVNTTNYSAINYVAYLFATCAGVSKVGGYTGTGTTLQIDCGFTAGARFVLIKRADASGAWYVWDTARGIVAGNDPYLLLNSTAAEVTNTDYIDTYSAGFEISSTAPAAINASGGTFIFLAIA